MSRTSDASTPEVSAVDAALAASKALVGVAARSLAVLDDDLTPAQYRALLVVVEGRATGPGDLATLLEVHPSNAGRLADRLVAKGLLRRTAAEEDRRHVVLSATPTGRAAVRRVLARRRAVLEELLGGLEPADVDDLARAFARFAEIAGEDPSVPAGDAWRLGWGA